MPNTAQTTPPAPPAEGELHQKWRPRCTRDHLFTRWELHHCLRETWSPRCLLTRFVSGEEADRFGANPVPTLLPRRSPPASPPRVSLIRVTHDSWVKPTLLRGIGLQFYHSFPFNAAKQQMSGLFMRPALGRRTRAGLPQQEGNLRGQIKSGVGCLLHGWLPPLAPWKGGKKKKFLPPCILRGQSTSSWAAGEGLYSLADLWPAAAQQEFAGVNGIFTDWPCQSDSVIFGKWEIHFCAATRCDIARPLLLGNIKLKVSDIPQNATRGFAIKGISIQKNKTKPNKNPEIMTDGFHSCSLKSIPHKEPRSCRLWASENMRTMRKRCQCSLRAGR